MRQVFYKDLILDTLNTVVYTVDHTANRITSHVRSMNGPCYTSTFTKTERELDYIIPNTEELI